MENCSSQPETTSADASTLFDIQDCDGASAKKDNKTSSIPDKHEESNFKSDGNQFDFPVASVRDTFPTKLYKILSKSVFEDVISWLPHGRSWRVLDQKRFETEVLPLYFRHGNFLSFMRQVNGWGFRRTYEDFKHNSFYHEHFIRGSPDLCNQMRRPVKNSKKPSSVTYPSPESDFCTEHQDRASSQCIAGSNTRNGVRNQHIRDKDALLCSNASDIPTHHDYGIPREAFGVAEVDKFWNQPQSLSCQENIIPSLNIFSQNLNPMLQMRPEQMAGALGSQRFLVSEANPYHVLYQYGGLILPEGGLINQNAYSLNDLMTLQNNLQPSAFNGAPLRASGNMKSVEKELLRRQFMMHPYNHHP